MCKYWKRRIPDKKNCHMTEERSIIKNENVKTDKLPFH